MQTDIRNALPPLPTKSGGMGAGSMSPSPRRTTPRQTDSNLEFELEDLRNEIRNKNMDIAALTKEIAALEKSISLKDDALSTLQDKLDSCKEKLLSREMELTSMKQELGRMTKDYNKMEKEMVSAQEEADRLNKLVLMQSQAHSKANKESQANIKRLESDIATAEAKIRRLDTDNRSCYQQIRTKDRVIEQQTARVRAAEEVISSQRDGQNKVQELQAKLDAVTMQLMNGENMQFLAGEEVSQEAKARKKMADDLDSTKRYLSRVKADLDNSQSLLRQSEARVGQLEIELGKSQAAIDQHIKEEKSLKAKLAKAESAPAPVVVAPPPSIRTSSPIIATFQEEEVNRFRDELKRTCDQLSNTRSEVHELREQKDKLLNRLDELADVLESNESNPDVAVYEDMVGTVRLQLADLREMLASKEADCAALEHACEASAASCALERVKVQALRVRLGEAMDPLDYEGEFGTEPPTVEEVEYLEKEATEWSASAAHAAKLWSGAKARTAQLRHDAKAKEKALRSKKLKKHLEMLDKDKQAKLQDIKEKEERDAAAAKAREHDAALLAAMEEHLSAAGSSRSASPDKPGAAVVDVMADASTPRSPMSTQELDNLMQHIQLVDTQAEAERVQIEESLIESEATVQRILSKQPDAPGMVLTDEAIASRLDEMNALSSMVSSLKMQFVQRENRFAAREEELLKEIAMLRTAGLKKAKGSSPFKKVLTGLSRSFGGRAKVEA